MSLDLFQIVSDAIDRRHREEARRENEERELEVINEGVTLEDICNTAGLSPDQVRIVMQENAERFEFCRLPDRDAAQRDLVLYRLRNNEETQPGWEPGVAF